MQSFTNSTKTTDRHQQLKLIHVAFFVAVNFRKIEQRFVSKFDAWHSLQHRPEDVTSFVVVAAAMSQHPS